MFLTGLRHLFHTLRVTSPNTRRFLCGTFLMGIGQGALSVHMNLYFRSAGIGPAECLGARKERRIRVRAREAIS